MADTDRSLIPDGGGLYACFTVDNISAGDAHRLDRLVGWLGERDMRATFFAVPYSFSNQATLYEDPELPPAIERARAAGHEFYLHGFDHELFECGMPELLAVRDDEMMRRIARTESRERYQLFHAHTRGKIGARLARGVAIWERTFGGEAPTGFRSPYHQFSRAMYFALEDLKIRWSSSRTATPAAYRPTVTPEADEVVSWVGLQPYWVGEVLELPHMANYGCHIAPDTVEDWVGLAKRHLAACQREQAPFISAAYYTGLRCTGDDPSWQDAGYAAYERIVDLARTEFDAKFVPMSTVVDQALAKPEAWHHREEYRR